MEGQATPERLADNSTLCNILCRDVCFYVVFRATTLAGAGLPDVLERYSTPAPERDHNQKQGRSTQNVVLRAFWFDSPRFTL